MSLLTSAGELAKDGLPNPAEFTRWKRDAAVIRSAAGHFLSTQFAWLPLIADIRGWAKQVERSDAILAQVKSTKAKSSIKVGYSFPADERNWVTSHSATARWWESGSSTGDGALATTTHEVSSRTWFEAEYRNLMPIKPDQYTRSAEYALRAKYLLGLELTPEVLWNLAPWSWAVDWLTNTGDILSSVSDTISDGLVLEHGWVMSHHRRKASMVTSPFRYNVNPNITLWSGCQASVLAETKVRFPAVPYFGFGSVGDLTARQLSILAALGIASPRRGRA